MSRSVSWGWGKGFDGREAARQAAQQALNHAGAAKLALGLVFVSQEFDAAAVVSGLGSILGDLPLWGISTSRVLIPSGEQARSVVVALLAGNDLNAKASYWPNFAQNSDNPCMLKAGRCAAYCWQRMASTATFLEFALR
jgi:hypothetical protein